MQFLFYWAHFSLHKSTNHSFLYKYFIHISTELYNCYGINQSIVKSQFLFFFFFSSYLHLVTSFYTKFRLLNDGSLDSRNGFLQLYILNNLTLLQKRKKKKKEASGCLPLDKLEGARRFCSFIKGAETQHNSIIPSITALHFLKRRTCVLLHVARNTCGLLDIFSTATKGSYII